MLTKITSEEECDKYLALLGVNQSYCFAEMQTKLFCKTLSSAYPVWWACRETARFQAGIYETTSTLELLNTHFPIFAHVSLEDPKMVAFTPDAQCGENDKQVRTTIGRLLSKYLPVLSQTRVQELIAEHESDLNTEIMWAKGQELTDLYKHSMGGTAACMSKTRWKVHPTVAYHTDEIRLAYIKKDDVMVARTLVYEPKDGQKTYIRVYPKNHALEKKLKKLGYVCGSFVGAKLNTVSLGSESYAMPYLDAHNTTATASSSTIALLDGQLTVINKSVLDAINTLGIAKATSSYTAEGYVKLTYIDSSQFKRVCAISGEEYSLLDKEDTSCVWVNNQVTIALSKNVPDTWKSALKTNTYRRYMTAPENTQLVNSELMITTPEELKENGYLQLDQTLYPGQTQWSKKFVTTASGKVIQEHHSITVYSYDGSKTTTNFYHKNELNLRTVLKLCDDTYCTKDSKYLTTTSGKRVIPGLNSYFTLIDGTYTLRKPKHWRQLYDKDVYSNDLQLLMKWCDDNRAELFKEYVLKSIKSSSRCYKLAMEFVPYTGRTKEDYTTMSIVDGLTKIAKCIPQHRVERSVLINLVAEMTAIEY